MQLHERAVATTAVVDRFRKKPFDWRGSATCIHVARAQMRALGHRPPAIPQFRSAIGARKALNRMGFADLSAALDSLLPRIAPAAMWVGDLAIMPGGAGFDAIVICAGLNVFGYHDDDPALGLVPIVPAEDGQFLGAWRL